MYVRVLAAQVQMFILKMKIRHCRIILLPWARTTVLTLTWWHGWCFCCCRSRLLMHSCCCRYTDKMTRLLGGTPHFVNSLLAMRTCCNHIDSKTCNRCFTSESFLHIAIVDWAKVIYMAFRIQFRKRWHYCHIVASQMVWWISCHPNYPRFDSCWHQFCFCSMGQKYSLGFCTNEIIQLGYLSAKFSKINSLILTTSPTWVFFNYCFNPWAT